RCSGSASDRVGAGDGRVTGMVADGAPERTMRAPTRARQLGRGRRRSSNPVERRWTWVIAVATGLGVMLLSDAAPTGTGWLDAAYRAARAVLVVVAAAVARRWSLTVAAGLVTICSTGATQFVGMAALALVVVMVFTDRRVRVLSALAGA